MKHLQIRIFFESVKNSKTSGHNFSFDLSACVFRRTKFWMDSIRHGNSVPPTTLNSFFHVNCFVIWLIIASKLCHRKLWWNRGNSHGNPSSDVGTARSSYRDRFGMEEEKTSRHQITKEMKFNIFFLFWLIVKWNWISFWFGESVVQRNSVLHRGRVRNGTNSSPHKIDIEWLWTQQFIYIESNLVHVPCVSANADCFSFFVRAGI